MSNANPLQPSSQADTAKPTLLPPICVPRAHTVSLCVSIQCTSFGGIYFHNRYGADLNVSQCDFPNNMFRVEDTGVEWFLVWFGFGTEFLTAFGCGVLFTFGCVQPHGLPQRWACLCARGPARDCGGQRGAVAEVDRSRPARPCPVRDTLESAGSPMRYGRNLCGSGFTGE